jgi:hypothetical protein
MLAAHMVTATRGGDQSANLQIETAQKAAEICNVSPRSVSDAKKVIANGSPALREAVKEGEVAVSAAAVVAELPKKEQTKIVREERVSEAAKEIKQAKKHNDSFDPAKLESQKPSKNGKALFNDASVEDLFRKLVRSFDDREQQVGGNANLYKKCHDTINVAYKAWKELARA